ncbi:CDGSH iron-sulfur domain-containing protein [Pseudoruegeria sp. SHC-113]|uniref:CDGSH iron-sulfur domain-containing protein n=1 Tax=Pseudoruegeria sp. SHC-113 TaxID=2855439 RepID=UPI0021BAC4A6|nr:CDGSH iron-sulfur domain-containing protein [Pseudoruegeria sp. SHC-113]MCT8158538.1 CDGSH iron-sulfur domain-containing protein [Pseudoruegeria sp. SHC-113]
MSDETPKIEERENGPLIAKHIHSLTGEDGAALEVKPVMALCRCGQSANKPFCDGTHTKVGFESRGGKPEGPDKFFTYEGKEVTVSFNPRLCGHAAECGRIASNIFDANKKPWVQPDNGTVAEVEAVVAACPSGALQMGTPPETMVAEGRAEIMIQKDGPYWVTEVPVETDSSAEGISERKNILCRCGKSGNKPYCDGTHRSAGWKSGD